jgi:hypothetical protein
MEWFRISRDASSTPLNKQAQTSPTNSEVSASGLAVSEALVELHLGEIRAESVVQVTVPPSSSIYPANHRNI